MGPGQITTHSSLRTLGCIRIDEQFGTALTFGAEMLAFYPSISYIRFYIDRMVPAIGWLMLRARLFLVDTFC